MALLVSVIVLSLNHRCLQSFLFNDDLYSLWNAKWLDTPTLLRSIALLELHQVRPVGLWIYGLTYRLFGMNGFAYHAIAMVLHILNALLVYRFGLLLTRSRFVALAACLVFTYQDSNTEAYWTFAAIFEILTVLFYVSAFACYLQARRRGGRWHLAAVPAFLLALGSKEMAVTLPVILTLYELLWDPPWRSPGQWRAWGQHLLAAQWPYYLIAGVFFVQKFFIAPTFGGTGPYAYVFTVNAWVSGMAHYLRAWFSYLWPVEVLFLLSVAILIGAIFCQDRVMLFGWWYVAITLLPVVFLPQHRADVYWYLPQLGIALLAGQLLQRVRMASDRVRWVARRMWLRTMIPFTLLVALLAAAVLAPGERKVHADNWWLALSAERRDFTYQLQQRYPTLPTGCLVIMRQAPFLLSSSEFERLLWLVYDERTLRGLVDPSVDELVRVARDQPVLYLDYVNGELIQQKP